MSRGGVFSAIYAGIRSIKWPHLGVVGNILGKEMGKDLPRAVGLSVIHWAPAISICNTANFQLIRSYFDPGSERDIVDHGGQADFLPNPAKVIQHVFFRGNQQIRSD